jgi:hypothetical protein
MSSRGGRGGEGRGERGEGRGERRITLLLIIIFDYS